MSDYLNISSFLSSAQHTNADLSSEIESLDAESVKQATGFLLVTESKDMAKLVVYAVRNSDNPNIYLKPIAVVSSLAPNQADRDVFCAFDHAYENMHEFDRNHIQASAIDNKTNDWISRIPNNNNDIHDTDARFKILRFCASRGTQVRPLQTSNYNYGYIYPQLLPFISGDQRGVENILDFLESQQLFSGQFEDKVHRCVKCDSAFINFKEVCPDCGSGDLVKDDLIHHFKCGHVDSLANFTKDNQLICPKCNENLRHIGVDYDKPSSIYKCNACSLQFQEAVVTSQCFSCNTVSDPEDLNLQIIKSYSCSAIGNNAALFGLDALFTSILQTDLQLYSNQELAKYLVVEKSRIERYKQFQSSVCFIYFGNLDALYQNLGRRAEQLFRELSAVFKSVFRESDLITARNESVFAVLMTETSRAQSEIAIQRLEAAVEQLFDESLKFRLDLRSEAYDVLDINDLSSGFDRFLNESTGA